MSITIELTGSAERLASRVAKMRGVSIEQAVEEAIAESARSAGVEGKATPSPEDIVKALDKLSLEFVALPVLDDRSIDEIIGYDEFGLPRLLRFPRQRQSRSQTAKT
jgi:antitoxin VapB